MPDGKQPFDLDALLRPAIRTLNPYAPIHPPDEGSEVIKLDGNENVYGCSPRVPEALRRLGTYHIYPDPDQRRLRHALEGYTGLDQQHIVAGAGSDELIDVILRLVINPGDKVIDCVPTFGMYSVLTRQMDGVCVEVLRRPGRFEVDINMVIAALDTATKVIFLASPNNPTGNVTPREDVLALLNTGRLVVVDEAYYEFSGETVASLVPAHPNLVVLRTFSKWAGLAGLRVGYGLASPSMIQRMLAVKQPYNINIAAEVAALVSMEDRDYLLDTVGKLVHERDRMLEGLMRLPFLEPLPSQANFILSWVRGRDARTIYEGLGKKGIHIRYFDTPLLRSAIRISAGKPEHTDAVLQALRQWT
jgi:histidinol-phosphate aminotransferase